MNLPRTLAVASLLLPLLLPGCATNPYARFDDPSDVCRFARAPLLEMGHDFEATVLGATAIGTGVGAASGAAIGRSWQDALIGAAAGAMAGALGGYMKAKNDQARTSGEVLGLIDQDAAHDTVTMRQASNAITNLIDCRNGQTRTIEAAYSGQQMTRGQALDGYRMVQARTKEDDELIQALLGAADKRADNYIGGRAQALRLNDPARAASPATQQLSASRGDAAAKEAAYQRFRAGLAQRINDLEKAVG